MNDVFKLKEEDIRPQLDVNYNREVLYYKDLRTFLKKFKNSFQDVDCVSCKSKNYYVISKKDGFRFNKCQECGTIFISPRPTPSALKWWYRNAKHVKHSNEILEKTAEKRKIINEDRIKKLFRRIIRSIESMLEIGCGNGIFLSLIKQLKPNLKITGIDLNPNAIELARKKDLNCFNFSAEEFVKDIADKYDLVVAFEVFEHIFNPKCFIQALSNMLKPGGYIYDNAELYFL